MSNYISEAEARETKPCPIARTFAEKKGANCDGDKCPLWRWKPRLSTDPGYTSAITREMANLAQEYNQHNEKHKTPEHFRKQATAAVTRNPEGFGITREQGHCGLGGPIT